MIRFKIHRRGVTLEYEPEFNSANWVAKELQMHGEVTVSRGFTFTEGDLLAGPIAEVDGDPDEAKFRFDFARRSRGYFYIEGRKLGIDKNVLIAVEGIKLERKLFVAERNVRIFSRLAKVLHEKEEIAIGGAREGAIPVAVFLELLSKFPNSGELDRYASARVEGMIAEFVEGAHSAQDNYEIYLSKRKPLMRGKPLPQRELLDAEIAKFEFVRDTIANWLEEDKSTYSEKDWQRLILDVILLILPKYVAVLENVELSDYYSVPGRITKRFVDLCLVDAGGTIDVIEIKRPFDNALLGRRLYRDNNVPTRELSGCIMQVEKYLFHLSKWGVAGEKRLTDRYKDKLPKSMSIRVTNPKALIILGRDRLADGQQALTPSQLFDLEVIKRKYANLIDILTYDDLLRRLNNIIASLTKRRDETKSRGRSQKRSSRR